VVITTQFPTLPAGSVALAKIDVVPLAVRLVVVIAFGPETPSPAAEIAAEQLASENRRRLVAASDRLTVTVGVCVAPGDTGLMDENVTNGSVVSIMIAF
jgi:hypothetical protein